MTKVFLNGKFVAQPLTGVQRFASEVVIAADRLLASGVWRAHVDFVLLIPSARTNTALPQLQCIKVQEIPCGRLHPWEQFHLARASGGRLLINLAGSAPLFKFNQVCTFHDAAVFDFPEAYGWAFVQWYRLLFRVQSAICRRVLTVSEFSKKRLLKRLNVRDGVIGVVPNGAEHVLRLKQDDSVIEKLQLRNTKYLLAVGSDNPSKNFKALVGAFSRLRCYENVRLVVVGGSNSAVFSRSSSAESLDPRVIRAGRVTDEQLKSLYKHALAFVFPSLYEGFGIPPLEAMLSGCPVLAARTASIPEVCGEAAAYFDPQDEGDMVRVLEFALANPQSLADLKQAGFERAALFTWDRAAGNLFDQLATFGLVEKILITGNE